MKTWVYRYLLLWAMGVAVATVDASRVQLVDNGYEGVVVAISREINETLGPPIIQAITEMIQEASRKLFRATHYRAYFRHVKILIPKSWTNTLVNNTALSENYEDSDIRIDHMNSVYQNQPYTHQPGGCGVSGKYIHLTPKYLTGKFQAWLGSRGKVLLVEWAKLRWGVFDELGYQGDESFPPFYILDDRENGGHFGGGKIYPTYCADKVVEGQQIGKRGHRGCDLNAQGEPDQNCRFFPHRDQIASSSLMSHPFIISDTVVDFCDDQQSDHPHNSVAPTKQNRFCGGRSVWSVMNDHPDFQAGANPPTDRYLDPVIELVQHTDAHYALVLDYSGSMNDHYRIHKLRKTARRWLLHEVAQGSYVAIIRFSKEANLVHPLTKVADEESRRALADSLGTTADGSTSIGAGLYFAVKTILNNVTNPVILLITDGKENENPRIEDIKKNVVESRIRVVTVAFGPEADPKLEDIAQWTGGKTFTVNDLDEGLMLEDAFEGVLTYQPPPTKFNSSVMIHEHVYIGNDTFTSGTFNVDFSIGRNLRFRLDTNDQPHVTQLPHLIRPDGSVVEGSEFDPLTYSWSITVPMAEEGEWQWKVGVSGSDENFVRVKVTAQTRDPKVEPITTKAWVSSGARDVSAKTERIIIYAEVKQGNNPVVNANVSALVTPPNDFDPPEVYFLLDNGQGADTQAGDGVYSRYMTKYYGAGRYSVKAQVTDGGQAVINRGFLTATSQGRRRRSPAFYGDLESPDYCCGSVIPLDRDTAVNTSSFNRVAVAGSIMVAEVSTPKVPDADVPEGSTGSAAPPQDLMPPCEVRDLRVSLTDPSTSHLSSHNISLSWTATGDDLDSGIASGYLILMSTDAHELTEVNFGRDPNDLSLILDPNTVELLVESGSRIKVTTIVEMDLNSGETYFFALRAVDKAGLTSPVSNLAMIHKPDLLEFMTFTSASDDDAYFPATEEEIGYPASGFTAYSPPLENEIHLSTSEVEVLASEEVLGEENPEGDWSNETEIVSTVSWDPGAGEQPQDASPSLALVPESAEDPSLAIPIWAIAVIVVFIVLIGVLVAVVLSKRRYGKFDFGDLRPLSQF
ncbi:calcium-activated chloride channel regulator 1-like isoform X2 [Macrobrachium nipponense]